MFLDRVNAFHSEYSLMKDYYEETIKALNRENQRLKKKNRVLVNAKYSYKLQPVHLATEHTLSSTPMGTVDLEGVRVLDIMDGVTSHSVCTPLTESTYFYDAFVLMVDQIGSDLTTGVGETGFIGDFQPNHSDEDGG